MRYIFLSYAHENAAFAHKLATDLKLEEIAVWIDYKDINVGDSFLREIERMLQRHDYFVPILSPEYFKSEWCKQELRSAFVRNIKEGVALLPVLHRDCNLPPLLYDRIYVDFRGNYEHGLSELVNAIRGTRRSAPIESRPEDIIVGGFIATSNPNISFDGKTFKPWMATCPQSAPEDYWHKGVEIEFDLTSYARSTLRITGIYIEVENCEPITQPVHLISRVLGLAIPRHYYCYIGKNRERYPCKFLATDDLEKEQGCYIRLTEREMEFFKLEINTRDEGAYDLKVIIGYSIDGKAKEILAGNFHCVVHNWKEFLEIEEMARQGKLPGQTKKP